MLKVKTDADKTAKTTKATKTTAATAVEETKSKIEAEVAAEGAVEAQVANEGYGKDSDKLIFIACLGDPSTPDKTPAQPDKGIKERTDPTIVGYQFKATVDLDVPDSDPGERMTKQNLMAAGDDLLNTRHVKAGEVFNLTKYETGALLSREEFNAKATGGEIPVNCRYSFKTKKTADGQPATVSAATAIPNIALMAMKGSVKDVPMVPVLTYTTEQVGNSIRKRCTIIEGFEKWRGLCKSGAKSKGRTANPAAAATNQRNANAEAFLKIMNAKKA